MPEISGWRICKQKWVASAFTGDGAAMSGGRWNSEGVRMIYASKNLAMAAFETYVHLPKPIGSVPVFVRQSFKFANIQVESPDLSTLPLLWNTSPVDSCSQKIGDEWIRSSRTALLVVPSTIIPQEDNYLLNPAHPDFSKMVISKPEVMTFDHRLMRLLMA